MPYIESGPTRRQVYGLGLLFGVLYIVNLGVVELRSQEALSATIASGMIAQRNLLQTTVHGLHVDAFPLYPVLIALCGGGAAIAEWTVRLPAALAVLGLAALCGGVARRAVGTLAGVVAAGMVLTNAVCLREGVRADSDTVFAFFIVAAWLSWYRLGREDRRWGLAWSVALTFVLAATLTAGLRAVLYFYLPFAFLRRPLRAWRRMLLPAHFIALAVLVAALVFWVRLVPGQPLLPWNTLMLRAVPNDAGSYARDLVLFPLKCGAYLLPWTFLVWPAFCIAYRPLEKDRVLSHYLRVLVFPLFIAVWLLPRVSPRALLPLIGPLSILTGMHYEILVRRHYAPLSRFFHVLLRLALVAGGVGIVMGAFQAAGVIELAGFPGPVLAWNLALLFLAVGLAGWGLRRHGSLPCWIRMLLAVMALRLVYLAVFPPLDAWMHSGSRRHGRELSQNIPVKQPVYRTVVFPSDRLLIRDCFYMRRPIHAVRDAESELPSDQRTVYVLSGAKPPIVATRTWTPCSAPIDLHCRVAPRVAWFPGGPCLLRIDIGPAVTTAQRQRPLVLRTYRGDLRW